MGAAPAKEINSKEMAEKKVMAKKANRKRRNPEGAGSSWQVSAGDLAESMNEDATRNTASKEEHQEEEQQQTDAKRERAVSASQSAGQSHHQQDADQAKEINSTELFEKKVMAKKANPKSEARSRRTPEGVGFPWQVSLGDGAVSMNEDGSRNTADTKEHQEEEQQQTDAKRYRAVSASQSAGQSHHQRDADQAKDSNSKELVEKTVMAKKVNFKSKQPRSRRTPEGVGFPWQVSLGDGAVSMNEDGSRNTADIKE